MAMEEDGDHEMKDAGLRLAGEAPPNQPAAKKSKIDLTQDDDVNGRLEDLEKKMKQMSFKVAHRSLIYWRVRFKASGFKQSQQNL
jgi:hypothetical protein